MTELPRFYECGICGHMHRDGFHGDCRQDDARFTTMQVEEMHGAQDEGWTEIDMEDAK